MVTAVAISACGNFAVIGTTQTLALSFPSQLTGVIVLTGLSITLWHPYALTEARLWPRCRLEGWACGKIQLTKWIFTIRVRRPTRLDRLGGISSTLSCHCNTTNNKMKDNFDARMPALSTAQEALDDALEEWWLACVLWNLHYWWCVENLLTALKFIFLGPHKICIRCLCGWSQPLYDFYRTGHFHQGKVVSVVKNVVTALWMAPHREAHPHKQTNWSIIFAPIRSPVLEFSPWSSYQDNRSFGLIHRILLLSSTAPRHTSTESREVHRIHTFIPLRSLLGPVDKCILNVESDLLAVSTDDLSVCLYDIHTYKPVRKFSGHGNRISDLTFSPDSRWLVTSCMDARCFEAPHIIIYSQAQPTWQTLRLRKRTNISGTIITSKQLTLLYSQRPSLWYPIFPSDRLVQFWYRHIKLTKLSCQLNLQYETRFHAPANLGLFADKWNPHDVALFAFGP